MKCICRFSPIYSKWHSVRRLISSIDRRSDVCLLPRAASFYTLWILPAAKNESSPRAHCIMHARGRLSCFECESAVSTVHSLRVSRPPDKPISVRLVAHGDIWQWARVKRLFFKPFHRFFIGRFLSIINHKHESCAVHIHSNRLFWIFNLFQNN